jgi:hypothetical protein
VRTCVLRSLASPNAASHCGHAWSLRCSCTVRTCVLRWSACPNAASHCGHAWSLHCSCTVRTCLLREPAVPNAASHCGHAWSLRCSCTVRTCVLRWPARPNAASHCGHACSLHCSCTVRTCVLRKLTFPVWKSHCGHACLRDLVSSFTILWLWCEWSAQSIERDARSTVLEMWNRMPNVRVGWTCGLHRCIRKTQTRRFSYRSLTSTIFEISTGDLTRTHFD